MFALCYTNQEDSLDHWRMYSNNGNGVCIGIPAKIFNEKENLNITKPTIVANIEENNINTNSDVTEILRPYFQKPYPVIYDNESKKSICKNLQKILKPIFLSISESKQIEIDLQEKNLENNIKITSFIKKATLGIFQELLFMFKNNDYFSEKEYRQTQFVHSLYHAKFNSKNITNNNESNSYASVYLESEEIPFKDFEGFKIIIGPSVKNRKRLLLEIECRLAKIFGDNASNIEVKLSNCSYR